MVAWNQVCKLKERGGGGVWILEIFVLGMGPSRKWWWRYFVEEESLWKKAIVNKYG